MNTTPESWMRTAIEVARGNPAAPFGAVIIDGHSGEERARGVNCSREDPTAHGEMVAIQALYHAGVPREHSVPAPARLHMITTAEPCPMCAAACFWAGIETIYYGVSSPWLAARGWRQIDMRAEDVLAAGGRPFHIHGDILQPECAALFTAARS